MTNVMGAAANSPHRSSIYRGHTGRTMFEASMHPVVLGRELEYLALEKRIHAPRIIRVASRWEITQRRKNGQLIAFEIR
jgi:hypothetical protein